MIQHIRKFLQLESASGILLLAFAMLAMLYCKYALERPLL